MKTDEAATAIVSPPSPPLSETWFRHRSSAVLSLVAAIAVIPMLGAPLRPLWLAVGVALTAAGAGLRLASARCLGRGARVHRAGLRGALVTWGPYRWSRNPLYLAAALIIAGLGAVAGAGPWALLLLPATLLVYAPIVRHEERALKEADPIGFDEYERQVPRWLGTPASRPSEDPERSPWAEVLRRERWLIPGMLLAVGGILAIREELLPLRAWIQACAPGIPPWSVVLGGVTLGALGNSLAIERKRLRRRARKAEP